MTSLFLASRALPIAAAIALLLEEADGLRDCHTLPPGDWTGEPEAKAHYDRIMAVVAGLEKLRTNNERRS